ncbi:MAG: tetratricopeptide repeat protein [Caldilineaceae bacterium]
METSKVVNAWKVLKGFTKMTKSSQQLTQFIVLQGLTGYSQVARQETEAWAKTIENGLRLRRNNDDLQVALGLNTAAEFSRLQGHSLQAEALWQRAVAIYQQSNYQPDANLAVIYNNLASFYRSQGCYSDAEVLFTQALSILSRVVENTHPTTRTVLNNFTQFLQQVVHENRVAELSKFEATQILLRTIKP